MFRRTCSIKSGLNKNDLRKIDWGAATQSPKIVRGKTNEKTIFLKSRFFHRSVFFFGTPWIQIESLISISISILILITRRHPNAKKIDFFFFRENSYFLREKNHFFRRSMQDEQNNRSRKSTFCQQKDHLRTQYLPFQHPKHFRLRDVFPKSKSFSHTTLKTIDYVAF